VLDVLDQFPGERARQWVELLASPAMAGRYPGSAGEQQAADTITAVLQEAATTPVAQCPGLQDPFSFEVCELRDSPCLQVCTTSGLATLEHLRDYAVNVQGAAGGGAADGEAIWLGRLDLPIGHDVTNRIGVVDGTLPGADATASFELYLRQLRAGYDAGLAALLRVHPSFRTRKVMIHARHSACLPSFTIAPHVVPRLFATPSPQASAGGRRVLVRSPLHFPLIQSAGNVLGSLGEGPIGLVLCAHYDHLGSLPDGRYFPGASDNASGVAVVLGAAMVLSCLSRDLPWQVVFLFTTGEETGMVGARRFVGQFGSSMHPDAAVICVDEISGHGRTPLVFLRSSHFNEPLLTAADGRRLEVPVALGQLRLPGYSDYIPFMEHGVRRVATLFSRERATGATHTLHDIPGAISVERLTAGGKAIVLAALRHAHIASALVA